NEVFPTPSIGSEQKRTQRFCPDVINATEQRCCAGVPKNGPDTSVGRVDELTVGFCRKEKNRTCLTSLDQSFRQSQTINVAGAPKVEVERANRSLQTQPVLDQAGCRREQVVGTLGTKQDEVDLTAFANLRGK